MEQFKVVDLFSGCGGFSYGFENAGFHVVLGVDNDEVALQTFAANHTNSKALVLDLHKDEAIDAIINAVGDNKIDVIIAGPPCQGFSLTGSRQEEDERNKLFYSVFKLAKRLQYSDYRYNSI
jgi:DNA (cytosine-5)-methyltransferase 1